MLQSKRDGHGREQKGPDEHVVDAQRLLDQVAADVLAERLPTERHGDYPGKEQGARDPGDRLPKGLARGGRMVVAVAQQIHGQHHRQYGKQRRPGPIGHIEIGKVRPSGRSCSEQHDRSVLQPRPWPVLEGLSAGG
jgi:hypothetical protein